MTGSADHKVKFWEVVIITKTEELEEQNKIKRKIFNL